MKNPECFGCPAFVPECRTCAVRQECLVEQRSKCPVFLLPAPRPTRRERVESAAVSLLGGTRDYVKGAKEDSDEAAGTASVGSRD